MILAPILSFAVCAQLPNSVRLASFLGSWARIAYGPIPTASMHGMTRHDKGGIIVDSPVMAGNGDQGRGSHRRESSLL
jgi:hypothetical protein